MRFAPFYALVALAACDKPQPAAPPSLAGTYVGVGRDALCVAGNGGAARAGFVTYGADDSNCTVSGRLEAAGAEWTLVPAGESDCRVAVGFTDGKASLGKQSGACDYYCGPGAHFGGKPFALAPKASPASDLAGDPLC